MQKYLNIPTSDERVIYGVLQSQIKEGSKKIIIFVHGYTGNCNEHFLFNASPFFNAQDFNTYRFNLYWYEKDARHTDTVTFNDHLADLNTVIDYFKNSYESIYLVGHSLGGQIICRSNLANSKIKAITLWEPCREPKEICAELEYNIALGAYIEHSNVDIVIGKSFVESCKEIKQNVTEIIPSIKIPIKTIGAGDAGAKIATNTYFAHITSKKELFIIENSNHTFDEEGIEKILFNETLRWFTNIC